MEEVLDLNITQALRDAERVGAALTTQAQRFKVALADALTVLDRPQDVRVTADTGTVPADIARAVDAADANFTATADTTGIAAEVTRAVDAADTGITVTADTAALDDVTAQLSAGLNVGDYADIVDALDDIADTSRVADIAQVGDAVTNVGTRGATALDGATLAGRGLTTTLRTVGAAAAGIGLLAFLSDSVSLASDLGEQGSAGLVTFGDSLDRINRLAEQGAGSVGLSRVQVLQYANDLGGLARALQLSEEASADLADTVIRRAADIGSLRNIDVPEVLEKIRSGLVGEAEPLRSLGVNLDAATVSAKAFELGLADANGEVGNAGLVQARLALILEQTDLAAGNFAATADGLANSSRTLSAEFADVRTEIGERVLPSAVELVATARADLLPVLLDLGESVVPLLNAGFRASVPVLRSTVAVIQAGLPILDALASVVEAIPEPALTMAAAFLAVRQAAGPLGGALQQTLNGMSVVNGLAGRAGLAGSLAVLSRSIGPVTVGLGLLFAGYTAISEAQRKAEERTLALRDALLDQGSALTSVQQVQAEFGSDLQKEQVRLGVTTKQLADAAAGTNAEFNALGNALSQRGATQEFQAGYLLVRKRLLDAAEAALLFGQAEGKFTQAQVDLAVATERTANGLTGVHGETVNYIAVLRALDPAVAQTVEQQEQVSSATTALAEDTFDVTAALRDLNTEFRHVSDRERQAAAETDLLLVQFGKAGVSAVEFQLALDETGLTAEALIARFNATEGAVDELAATMQGGSTAVRRALAEIRDDTSLAEFLANAREQAVATARFVDNLAALQRRGATDLARALSEAGPAAALAAQQAAALSDRELARREADLDRTAAIDTAKVAQAEKLSRDLIAEEEARNAGLSSVPPPDLAGPLARAYHDEQGVLRRESAVLREVMAEETTFTVAEAARRARLAAVRDAEAQRTVIAQYGRAFGAAYAQGIAQGIDLESVRALNAARRLTRDMVREAREELDSRSPSRVMADVGRDAVAGLVEGLAPTSELSRAMAALTEIPTVTLRTLPAAAQPAVVAGAAGGDRGLAAAVAAGVREALRTEGMSAEAIVAAASRSIGGGAGMFDTQGRASWR